MLIDIGDAQILWEGDVFSDLADWELDPSVHTISDDTARTVASWYQSPGRVGHVFAQLASTGKADWDELLTDLQCTPENTDEDATVLGAFFDWLRTKLPRHVDYPHSPGYLIGCPACEAECYCRPGQAECVYGGDHR